MRRRAPAPRAQVPALVAAVLLIPLAAGADPSLIDLYEGLHGDAAPAPQTQAPPATAAARAVAVRVRGITGEDGSIRVFVYDDAAAWAAYDYTRAVGYARVATAAGSVEIEVAVAGSGPWAAFAFHDADDDGVFDTERRAPLEAYGHSGATNPYFPPGFETAARAAGPLLIDLTYPPRRR